MLGHSRVCLNWRMYFLWHLSRMSLERKMSNVGGHLFGGVTRKDFLIGLFIFDGGYLDEMGGANMDVVVVEMVVGVVLKVV